MNFRKWVALTLVWFSLFAGYRAWSIHQAKQERCAVLYGDFVASGETREKYLQYLAVCKPDSPLVKQ